MNKDRLCLLVPKELERVFLRTGDLRLARGHVNVRHSCRSGGSASRWSLVAVPRALLDTLYLKYDTNCNHKRLFIHCYTRLNS